ncbi:MAG: F420-dependent oxidoreductase [Solirubrobacterales bacterium]|nr:F420-dependent oxidoreductase [Solirubrobacterales bacterium]
MRHADRAEVADAAAELEELGYTALWIPEGASGPIFEACGELLGATARVPVATGILNVWAHEPAETAADHARLAAAHPGRFLLGLGIGHAAMVDRDEPGRYRKPVSTMRSYLDGLDAADTPVPREERILAALGPKMLELARERTLGSHPYFTSVEHTAAAREILGPGAVLAPEVAVVPEPDRERARAIAREYAAIYLTLPNYTNNLLRHGFTEDDLRDGGSDRLIDAVIPGGDAERLAEALRAHFDAGADHVCVQVLTGGDRSRELPRTAWRELAPVVAAL